MQCFTELTPPTAVTHSLNLSFLSPDAVNLVVAKTSILQIFKIKTLSVELDVTNGSGAQFDREGILGDRRADGDDGFQSSFLVAGSAIVRSERANTTKLVLVAEYALSATITSMVRVKTLHSKSGGDSLLLAFKDAKLSLVEWDPERHGLSTISIHYYEQDDNNGSPWAPKLSDCVNYLSVDPGSRCAALKFGVRNLAILPFKQSDEDTAMDDWDEELDGPRPAYKVITKLNNGDAKSQETPHTASFVLRLSSLDPSLMHAIHLAFLYEYREPTFGILSSTISPASSLIQERKDQLSYMVFTLDLEQRASTTILAVTGLPYDLSMVIPLAPPVGGVLLVGGNEVIHVDQSGKANGVAVNTFAKQCTSFGLVDQGDLEMRLEGCKIEQLSIDDGEMLIILKTGELAIISFRMDGRSVSGLSLRRVVQEAGGSTLSAKVSCASVLSRNSLFIGSDVGDSVVIGWSRKSKEMIRRRSSQVEGLTSDGIGFGGDDDEDEDVDDDDLYGDGSTTLQVQSDGVAAKELTSSKAGDYSFRINDSLGCIAPLRDITLSKPYRVADGNSESSEGTIGPLEIVAVTGHNKDGALVILKREIEPKVIGRFDFQEARGVWTMSVKRPFSKALQLDQTKISLDGEHQLDAQFDRLMIVSKAANNSPEESTVYALTSAGFEALSGTEFEPAAGTIEAGTLGNGMRVVQVLKSEVRSYDGDLGLAQILPMFDDETGAEPKIVSASLADPFLLLVRDDASIFVARCGDDNELEEVDQEDDKLLTTNWLSGCLYQDMQGTFAKFPTKRAPEDEAVIYIFLLSAESTLYMYALPDLSKPVYVAEGLSFIPPTLSPRFVARRSTARETLTEILVADLGDATSKTPYLILRAANDDLTIYEPFRIPSSEESSPVSETLHFLKMHNPHVAKNPDVAAEQTADEEGEVRDNPMRVLADVRGFSTVFLPGSSPTFVLKSSTTAPKVVSLRGAGVRGLSSFHTAGCDRGFIYVDTVGVARVCQLAPDVDFTQMGMTMQKVSIGEDICAVAYCPPMDVYAIGTSTFEEFQLPNDDDYHREWQKEDIAFKPLVERGCIKLISPRNWSIIDIIELDASEIVTCIKTLNLEISETTHERKQMITVGTAISRGEDLAIRGCIYVYEAIIVVPEPGRPETNKKLKLMAKEEIPRGAITGISEIGTQGCMVVAQGQKLMVRGLKEDGTLLPVAFMDMNTYVTSIKELPGTGLCVLADALKGVWFAGYAEEPYRMTLFGKQIHEMEVVAAEILPIGRELYIVSADVDGNLHILQFDPEHPKSLHGQRLLHRTTFSLGGHIPTTMTLLPRTKATTILPPTIDAMETAAEETIPDHQILITTTSGAIFLLSPLSEAQYRRLGTVANHLSNALYHPCGLNPKAYRVSNQAPEAVIGGRPVVDGAIIMRWTELGSQRRAEIAGRVGVDAEQIRDDLEALQSGLEYL